ncbi:hypothetical protein [Azospirillum soli]|uniref:hypothetical protein n=1 Tax=Azospirillum soli TaxID=1304799 RepID=UPI001AE96D88|nr:hypothetical protein [Azospirillum soli]MBP2310814.1 hypothetical protein [Azospirillum soli]
MERGDLTAGRYDKVRQLLSRLDRKTRARLFDELVAQPTKAASPTSPMMAMLLDVLTGRRRSHARRLWTRWLEPVMVRDRALLSVRTPLPGCIRLADAAGWWVALSRRMGDTPADIQDRMEECAASAPLDRVLASEEAERWSETLRCKSLAALEALHDDPTERVAVLAEANAERARMAPNGVPARPLDASDLLTLTAALRAGPDLRRLGGAAQSMDIDRLIALVRDALTGCGAPPDAMALFAVAGLYARRDPVLGAALRALMPLPLVENAVTALDAFGVGGQGTASEVRSLPAAPATGLDRGLMALFDAASDSGRPLSPDDAKRLGRALAGVVDSPAPTRL